MTDTMANAADADQQAYRDHLTLMSEEVYWRDHQLWLARQGYMLRPRYRPGWVPSWKDSGKRWVYFEDGLTLGVRRIISSTFVLFILHIT